MVDETKLSSRQYIEDYWKLLMTVTNSVHTTNADETRLDLSRLIGVGSVNETRQV